MTPALIPVPNATPPLSLEEFLTWDSGTEQLYELIEGEPMPMSDPTADHEDVADNLCDLLKGHCLEYQLPFIAKRSKLIFVGERNGKQTARRADIILFDQGEWEQMKGQSRSAMAYAVPPLVIEVVSTNWRDDYLTKLAEYEAIGVREYWVVDYAARGGMRYIGQPKQPMLSIYSRGEGETEYGEPSQFREADILRSPMLPGLSMLVEQLLQA